MAFQEINRRIKEGKSKYVAEVGAVIIFTEMAIAGGKAIQNIERVENPSVAIAGEISDYNVQMDKINEYLREGDIAQANQLMDSSEFQREAEIYKAHEDTKDTISIKEKLLGQLLFKAGVLGDVAISLIALNQFILGVTRRSMRKQTNL